MGFDSFSFCNYRYGFQIDMICGDTKTLVFRPYLCSRWSPVFPTQINKLKRKDTGITGAVSILPDCVRLYITSYLLRVFFWSASGILRMGPKKCRRKPKPITKKNRQTAAFPCQIMKDIPPPLLVFAPNFADA